MLTRHHSIEMNNGEHGQTGTTMLKGDERIMQGKIMGWLTGLEPATTGITILDSTN
jgi:hypothetical protein